ncbi:hypothetical protein F4818DRAFT_443488 [Hypoxylon cercidicola]|nr:hypothetical protein F4818DRAFT_443488 [Hypoxylon cercidicola]
MEECLAGCCAEICGRGIIKGLATGICYIIDKLIVQRRELVVRLGRGAQRILHIPECLCVFIEEELGMLDSDIRMTGTLLSFTYLIAGLAVVVRPAGAGGDLWGPWICIFGISFPLGMSLLAWFMLLLSKRRRLSGTPREAGSKIGDRSLEEDVNFFWSTAF